MQGGVQSRSATKNSHDFPWLETNDLFSMSISYCIVPISISVDAMALHSAQGQPHTKQCWLNLSIPSVDLLEPWNIHLTKELGDDGGFFITP